MTRTLARLSLAVLAALATAAAHPALAAEPAGGTLRGVVTDPSGAAVGQAQVAVSMAGAKRTVRTDARGAWSLPALRPGTYLVVVTRTGFAPFTQSGVAVAEGAETTVDAHLEIAPVRETVTVRENQTPLGLSADRPPARSSSKARSSTRCRTTLTSSRTRSRRWPARRGPKRRPDLHRRLHRRPCRQSPPSAIRLNSNPFSAEYDRPGFGRIEILTKPGSEALAGRRRVQLRRRRP